jgi:ribosomal protein S27AE
MSIGNFLWDFYQQQQINETSVRVNRTRADAEEGDQELERKLERMQLVNMAMWSLCKDKLGLTDEDLADKIRQVDMLDGLLDGRVSHQGKSCPRCKRIMSIRHKKCLYCGEVDLKAGVF